MNIYELEKQTTSGPWVSHHGLVFDTNNDPIQLNPENGIYYTKTEEANANYICHCRNNFLEALEFMGKHSPCHGCSGSDMLACGMDTCLLARLEKFS